MRGVSERKNRASRNYADASRVFTMKNRPVNIEGEKCPFVGCLYAITADSIYRFAQAESPDIKTMFRDQLPHMLARIRRSRPECKIKFCINRDIVLMEEQKITAISERAADLGVKSLELLQIKHSIEQGEWDHDKEVLSGVV